MHLKASKDSASKRWPSQRSFTLCVQFFLILLQQVHLFAAKRHLYIYTWLQWLQFKLEGATLGPQNLEPGFFSCKHPAVGGVDIISIIMIIDTPPGQKMAQPQGEMFFKLKGFACSIWGLAV